MSFDQLKRNREAALNKLVNAASAINSGKSANADDTWWTPTVDKAGNAYAVIRFLDTPKDESMPWIRWWDHGFKGPTGRWYIEKSLSSIGQDDPVGQLNARYWNTGNEKDKDIARSRKRRLHYASNILVISDPANPSAEGKVKRFKYGKKVFEKINDQMMPQFPGETPVNPFDFWAGANFRLKIRKVDGFPNYDKCEFDKPSPLFDGDESRLRAIYEELHPLAELVDPANYKSYDELKRKLIDVLGEAEVNGIASPSIQEDVVQANVGRSLPPQHQPETTDSPFEAIADDDDSDVSYFARLAQS
jgi:hypothetical protein